ncbi:MAG: hypothetical protein K2G83_01510 [Ruminococcus sp.]|nr:hypothetical protein [Ruminococcus sp.]
MNLKNIISVILILMLTTVSVKTTENSSETIAFSADYDTVAGLIEKCSISCSENDGILKIYAKTQASGLMNEIGFRNIIIQSSNDLKSWTDVINLGDFIESDRKYYTLSYSTEVAGNCYYRAACIHYANGIPFMKTDSEIQTAENFSKAIWIDSIPSFTLEPAPTILTTTKETETTSLTNTSAQTTASDTNFLKIHVLSEITPNTIASEISTETTVNTSSKINKKTVSDSPSTGVNTPSAVFFISVISIITAIKSRKKLK